MSKIKNVFGRLMAAAGTFCGFFGMAAVLFWLIYDGGAPHKIRWDIVLTFLLLLLSCGIMGISQLRRLKYGDKMFMPVLYFLLTVFAVWWTVSAGVDIYKRITMQAPYGLTNGIIVLGQKL